jgi:hypothetical protein
MCSVKNQFSTCLESELRADYTCVKNVRLVSVAVANFYGTLNEGLELLFMAFLS